MAAFPISASFPFLHMPISICPFYFPKQFTSPGIFHSRAPTKFKLFSSPVSVRSPLEAANSAGKEEKFDWYSQWYPVMAVCDLDKRVPHAKKVLGIDIVVWWDRNENAWKVFEDMCPHSLAPLSEGRIDQWGRLQCVYHGWCFDASGNCKLISSPWLVSMKYWFRLIWAFPRNFGAWLDKVVQRGMFHVGFNLVLDSDLYLVHVEERKIIEIKEIGIRNWQEACFVPTKSDALVVGFRRWFNEHTGGEVDWRSKYTSDLPPAAPREQLMDRYWAHVVNCSGCSSAYKSLNALETALQVVAGGLVAIVAATVQSVTLAGEDRVLTL